MPRRRTIVRRAAATGGQRSQRQEIKEYWDAVLHKAIRVIQRMSVPQLVRLVSDDIFAVKTGCGFMEEGETLVDLHVNQLIRIVVEETLTEYLKCEEKIVRERKRIASYLDKLMKIKNANKSLGTSYPKPASLQGPSNSTLSVEPRNRRSKALGSRCSIM